MKTIINLIIGIIFLTNISFANNLSYKLQIANINFTSEKTLEFDIIMFNTSPDKDEIRYAAGQYFLDFNSKIANGGKLTYSIISSDLSESMRPQNPTVFNDQLRLAVNVISTDKKLIPVIQCRDNGILIARMKLETSSDKFADNDINLKWSDGSNKLITKIAAFINDKVELISNSENQGTDNSKKNNDENLIELPKEYSLLQNYPNPFNPSTTIKYELPNAGYVTLRIYDITGREVATLVNEQLNAGRYEATFNGNNVASGVYFYKIQAGSYSSVKRMVLIK